MSTVKSFAYRAFKERSSYNKSVFPQCQGYYSCYWSCHAMPATSATTQRSFSSLRCVKLYLRTTVIEARIRGLVCLASISLCNWDTYSWRPLHTHTLQASCEQEHEAHLHICKTGHGRQAWLWWPTKIHRLCHLQAVPLDSKHTEASFSPNWTNSLSLQLAQVSRSPDLANFVSMTTMTTEPITLPLAHACGVMIINLYPLREIMYWHRRSNEFILLIVSACGCLENHNKSKHLIVLSKL